MRRRLLFLSVIAVLVIGMSGAAGALLGARSSVSPRQAVESQADQGPEGSDPSVEPAAQPPAPSGQRPATNGQPPVVEGQRLPPGHPPLVRAPGSRVPGTHAPGLVQQRELRRRVAEAIELGRRARAGEAAAKDAVAAQLAGETDPRVRQALATGEPPPDLGQPRGWTPPVLPEPVAAAEAGEVRAYWLTPGSRSGTYESTVTVDGTGHAQVETVHETDDGERWHVRYPAWAYRDAQGRLVVDARGQPVECLQKPEWGWWSPDSMLIGKDGLIDMIDDKHDPGQGTSGANGSG